MKSIFILGILFITLISHTTTILIQLDYTDTVNKLKDTISNTTGIFYHSTYERLAKFSDTFGSRLWGSQALQNAILDLYQQAKSQGFDRVRLQAVKNFTKWVRGNQQLWLHSPRPFPTPLKVIGLGGTVPGHIKANVLVVDSFQDLEKNKQKVKGKIVVYNAKWKGYYETVDYRAFGAKNASKYGAVAALIRSITPDSIQSVHAGIQHYGHEYTKIPVAAITTQDAQMLSRMQSRNQSITLQLKLQSTTVPYTYSNNVVFEITGTTKPQQIIIMGGHIDSWDTGSQTGVNDDGGGLMSCYQAMRLILKSGVPRPKRTLRFVAWSGEQWGGYLNGAYTYILAHKEELGNVLVAFQDDLGNTKLQGFGYSGHPEGKAIVTQIRDKYLSIIGATKLIDDGSAVDTEPLYDIGIPSMANKVHDQPDQSFYFTYHHTAADSITMMNADDLDSNVLGISVLFYILADLQNSIPKPKINLQKLHQLMDLIARNQADQSAF